MKRNFDKLIVSLIVLIFTLSIVSIYVLKNDREARGNIKQVDFPVVKIKTDIRFEINPNELEKLNYVDDIVDLDNSICDDVEISILELDDLGFKVGQLYASLGDVDIMKSFRYEVYDDKVPIIHQLEPFITTVGNKIDFINLLRVDDNSLGEEDEIIPKISGNINWDRAGVYQIHISATDEAGNQASYNATVTVQGVIDNTPQVTPPTPAPQPTPTPDPVPEPEPEPDPGESEEDNNEPEE